MHENAVAAQDDAAFRPTDTQRALLEAACAVLNQIKPGWTPELLWALIQQPKGARQQSTEDEWFSVKKLAEKLNVSERGLYREMEEVAAKDNEETKLFTYGKVRNQWRIEYKSYIAHMFSNAKKEVKKIRTKKD